MSDQPNTGESVRVPRWEFVRISRQPSGFGVARMVVRHPEGGSVVTHLTVEELRSLAMQALDAMDSEPALPTPADRASQPSWLHMDQLGGPPPHIGSEKADRG